MESLKDIWFFIRERKQYWLAPMVIILVLMGLLVVFGSGSAIAPFIYSLF